MIPDINLLPQREKQSKSGKWLLNTFIFLGMMIFLFMVIQYMVLTKNIQALEVDKEQRSVERDKLIEELAILNEPKAFDLEASVEFVEKVSYAVSPLIIEFNRYLGENAYLKHYTFGEETVSITVDFETISEVAKYVEDLSKSAFVKDVIVHNMQGFDPTLQEKSEKRFDRADRYTNTFEVLVDLSHLRKVGGEKN